MNGKVLTASLFKTRIKADIFNEWIVKILLLILPQDIMIVMDNAAFHKQKDIQKAVNEAGHVVEYLPYILQISTLLNLKCERIYGQIEQFNHRAIVKNEYQFKCFWLYMNYQHCSQKNIFYRGLQ